MPCCECSAVSVPLAQWRANPPASVCMICCERFDYPAYCNQTFAVYQLRPDESLTAGARRILWWWMQQPH